MLLLNVNGGLFANCFRDEVTSLKKIKLNWQHLHNNWGNSVVKILVFLMISSYSVEKDDKMPLSSCKEVRFFFVCFF